MKLPEKTESMIEYEQYLDRKEKNRQELIDEMLKWYIKNIKNKKQYDEEEH